MPQILIALVALLLMNTAACSGTPPSPTTTVSAALFARAHPDNRLLHSRTAPDFAHPTPVALSCCKVCSVGKACGNTCISRNKTCHVGPGCACDG